MLIYQASQSEAHIL